MNKESSRSHSVLTTIIETKSMKDSGVWASKHPDFTLLTWLVVRDQNRLMQLEKDSRRQE
jgi:hypothetical protein